MNVQQIQYSNNLTFPPTVLKTWERDENKKQFTPHNHLSISLKILSFSIVPLVCSEQKVCHFFHIFHKGPHKCSELSRYYNHPTRVLAIDPVS